MSQAKQVKDVEYYDYCNRRDVADKIKSQGGIEGIKYIGYDAADDNSLHVFYFSDNSALVISTCSFEVIGGE